MLSSAATSLTLLGRHLERADHLARILGVHVALSGLRGAERIVYFDMPGIAVSSSMVRRRTARGEPIRYLVPDAVADLVEERGLYRAPEAVAAS